MFASVALPEMLNFSAFQITQLLKGPDAILHYGSVGLKYVSVPGKICAVYIWFFMVLMQLQ